MHHYTRFLGACVFAGLLAACSGQNTSSLLPNSPPPGSDSAPLQTAATGPDTATMTTQSVATTTSKPFGTATTYEGKITALQTGGGFTLLGSSGSVAIRSTSTTTHNAYAGTAAVGHYAVVVGTGSLSTGLTATYIATFTTSPGLVRITGTYSGATTYGIRIKTSTNGYLPVLAGAATTLSGTLTPGASITVSGTGSAVGAVLAASVTGVGGTTATATPTPDPGTSYVPSVTSGTTTQRHVLTASYLGLPFGSTTVSPSRAAPYLSWASTGAQNGNAMHAAGLKVEVYVDADRQTSKDPLYTAGEAAFAHSCTSARIHDYFDHVTQYMMNNGSSTMRTAYARYVATKTAGQHVDAMYEDDAVAPSIYASGFFSPGLPCGYSDSAWLNAERGMEAAMGKPTIVNGLSAYTNHGPSLTLQLTSNPSTIGGNLESCYVNTGSPHEASTWVWQAAENTELQLAARSKIFQCMAIDYTSAPSAIASRLYTIASFLMTYNPATSMLWENYATPSKVGVMPESQLVPLSPVVATPSSIAGLAKSTGVYAREYRSCYYAGRLIGQCAVVVNSDRVSHPAPRLSLAYHHTIQLHGYGVLDGGTVTFAGPAAPSTMGALSAYVAVP